MALGIRVIESEEREVHNAGGYMFTASPAYVRTRPFKLRALFRVK